MNQANRKLILVVIAAVFAALQVKAQAPTPASPTAPATPPAQVQSPAPNQPANGTYVSTDPLAGVRYDNKWDVSVELASAHIHAGPNLREGADLGGLDLSGSYLLSKRFRIEASGRGYLGTSGTTPAASVLGESGVFVAQYMFLAGPQFLGPHNKHGAILLHALVGGAYGDFNKELGHDGSMLGPTGPAAFYNNQFALGAALGGHIDLNRSAHWVFRISPDALVTGYDVTGQYSHTQWNFGIAVGAQYKLAGKKK